MAVPIAWRVVWNATPNNPAGELWFYQDARGLARAPVGQAVAQRFGRAAARGFAIILRAQGHTVDIYAQ